MEKIITTDKCFECPECGNNVAVPEGKKTGDYFECEFCGIEYKVIQVLENGEYVVSIIEDEK